MDELDLKYARHSKNLTTPCLYTWRPDGGNPVICDCVSACFKCGWNPEVAAARKAKIRANPPKPKEERERWMIGRGAFPVKDGVEWRDEM